MLLLGVNDILDCYWFVIELYRLKVYGYICNRYIVINFFFWRYLCLNFFLEGYKCLYKLGYYNLCIMFIFIIRNDKFIYL